MTVWDEVRRIALDLPETSERVSRDLRQWRVKDKLFGWVRVDAAGLRTKRQLEPWVRRGVSYARSLPPK